RRVGQREHNTIDGLKTQFEQVQREVAAEGIDGAVRVAAIAVDNGNAVAEAPEDRGEFLGKRFVLPVPLVTVERGECRRKWNHSIQHLSDLADGTEDSEFFMA